MIAPRTRDIEAFDRVLKQNEAFAVDCTSAEIRNANVAIVDDEFTNCRRRLITGQLRK